MVAAKGHFTHGRLLSHTLKIDPVHNLLHHVVEIVTLGLVLAGEKERKSIVFGLRCSLENAKPENCSEHCSLDFSGFRFFVTFC